eukprot:353933-Chlamydomonas_euryale.AAC.6
MLAMCTSFVPRLWLCVAAHCTFVLCMAVHAKLCMALHSGLLFNCPRLGDAIQKCDTIRGRTLAPMRGVASLGASSVEPAAAVSDSIYAVSELRLMGWWLWQRAGMCACVHVCMCAHIQAVGYLHTHRHTRRHMARSNTCDCRRS